MRFCLSPLSRTRAERFLGTTTLSEPLVRQELTRRSAGGQSMGRATTRAPNPRLKDPAMLPHSQLPKWPVNRMSPLPLAMALCTLSRPWQRAWAVISSGLKRTRRGISVATWAICSKTLRAVASTQAASFSGKEALRLASTISR